MGRYNNNNNNNTNNNHKIKIIITNKNNINNILSLYIHRVIGIESATHAQCVCVWCACMCVCVGIRNILVFTGTSPNAFIGTSICFQSLHLRLSTLCQSCQARFFTSMALPHIPTIHPLSPHSTTVAHSLHFSLSTPLLMMPTVRITIVAEGQHTIPHYQLYESRCHGGLRAIPTKFWMQMDEGS